MQTYPVVNLNGLGQPIGTGEAPRAGCTKLGVQTMPFRGPALEAAMEKASADGLQIVPVSTGRMLNQGTRSETVETIYWACPSQPVTYQTTAISPSESPVPASSQASVSSAGFPSKTVLAVGGLAAAGLIAFLALR